MISVSNIPTTLDIIKNNASKINWEDYNKEAFDEQKLSCRDEGTFIAELNTIMYKNSQLHNEIKVAVSNAINENVYYTWLRDTIARMMVMRDTSWFQNL